MNRCRPSLINWERNTNTQKHCRNHQILMFVCFKGDPKVILGLNLSLLLTWGFSSFVWLLSLRPFRLTPCVSQLAECTLAKSLCLCVSAQTPSDLKLNLCQCQNSKNRQSCFYWFSPKAKCASPLLLLLLRKFCVALIRFHEFCLQRMPLTTLSPLQRPHFNVWISRYSFSICRFLLSTNTELSLWISFKDDNLNFPVMDLPPHAELILS